MQQAVWASLWVLRFASVMPPVARGAWRRLFAVYTALVLAFSVGGVGSCGVSIQSYWGVVGEVTPTVGNIIMLSAGIGKSVAILTREDKFHRLLQLLDELVVSQAATEKEVDDTFRRGRLMASRLTLGLVGYVFFIFMLWAAVPFVNQGPEKQLPFCHIRALDTPVYEVHFCVQFASTFYWIWLSVGVDCFFASVMTQVTCQFKLLNRRLARLGHRHDGSAGLSNVTEQRQATMEVDKMDHMLVQCVKSHQQILNFVDHFQEAVGPVALTQFAASVTVVCMTLCISTFNSDGGSLLKSAMYLPIPAIQMYLYCHCAHEIIEQSEAVSFSAYSADWVYAGRAARSSLLLVMCRATRACALSAAGFCSMDRGASVSLLNASYSFYALFRQVNNR